MPRIPAEVDEPSRTATAAAALHASSWPLSGLPCPFLFLPVSLFLFLSVFLLPSFSLLSFALSLFPFFSRSFVSSVHADDDGRGHGQRFAREGRERKKEREERNTSSCRSSHTFQGAFLTCGGTLPSVPVPRRTRNRRALSPSRASRLIIRRRSLESPAADLIKGMRVA